MKTSIRTEYALGLLSALNSLRDKIGDIPDIFFDRENANNIPHPEGVGFEVNRFLKVFDKIKLKKGFTLDYTYHSGGLGGEPLIYTRKKEAPRLLPYEYIEKYSNTRPYLNDITIEINPESFFQIAVFSQIVNQFYLFWHANYNDHQFIFSFEKVDDLLKHIPEDNKDNYGINRKDREELRTISFEPQVNIKEEGAEVRCVMFSAWIGFYYNISFITWPNITIKNSREIIVPFDCGINF